MQDDINRALCGALTLLFVVLFDFEAASNLKLEAQRISIESLRSAINTIQQYRQPAKHSQPTVNGYSVHSGTVSPPRTRTLCTRLPITAVLLAPVRFPQGDFVLIGECNVHKVEILLKGGLVKGLGHFNR